MYTVLSLKGLGLVVLLTLASVLAKALYNVLLHPLRSYPGPRIWAASRLPLISWSIKGRLNDKIKALHDHYGPVVRVGPDELTYESGQVWKEIYGHRSPEMPKSLKGHGLAGPSNGVHAITTVPSKEDHSRMRRSLAYAFSEKALRAQERFLTKYVNILIEQLRTKCSDGPVDMVQWYNFTTFDAIGDLAFGESFDCLTTSALHPWVKIIFDSTKAIPYVQALNYYGLGSLRKYLIPPKLARAIANNQTLVTAKIQRRLDKGVDKERGDFLSYLLRVEEGLQLSLGELQTMSKILIVGGSETTATLLSGATYYLLKTPAAYRRLVHEIRSRFDSESEISLMSVGELPYLNAVLEESLRVFPPVPASLPRITPPGGETIMGRYVPGGVAVGVHQWSASRSARNWAEPQQFRPERWLRETEEEKATFSSDDRSASQPFGVGPRNCIGRNLAYAEMRLILARVLWNFDLELAPGSNEWAAEQLSTIIWQKSPLMILLKKRRIY
ncbi:cytochrome P450 [Pyrenochaeta sp. MPI-SDFR-AT-0127]|nr:cytochrome P450 [Pyrenochaeta sp. MPI-SDFR-AT-0127]